jgi:hypothetical protein
MKKMFYTTFLALALTGSAFAINNAKINPKIVPTANQIVNIHLSTEMTKKTSSLTVELTTYNFECSNGSKASGQFSSMQSAFDWGMKYCAAECARTRAIK